MRTEDRTDESTPEEIKREQSRVENRGREEELNKEKDKKGSDARLMETLVLQISLSNACHWQCHCPQVQSHVNHSVNQPFHQLFPLFQPGLGESRVL